MVLVEDGCLLCGVSHQSVSATVVAQAPSREQVARDLWTPKRTSTQQLGGQLSPASISGYLCRPCTEAVEHAHAMGPTALMRALVAAVAPQGVGMLGWGKLSVDGLVGWAVLVAEARRRGKVPPPPNRTPWAHLPDLDRVTEQVRSVLGVG